MEEAFQTTQLQRWLRGMEHGDAAAREELVRHAWKRFLSLTRKLLQDFPRVRSFEETDDVAQRAGQRLLRVLGELKPATTRDFFRLAALQVRRELLDLAKHLYGPLGPGANLIPAGQEGSHPFPDAADNSHDPARLARWSELHELIGRLPDDEREVVQLLYYQGLSQAEAASLLGVSVRTVQRRWQSALLRLHDLLGD